MRRAVTLLTNLRSKTCVLMFITTPNLPSRSSPLLRYEGTGFQILFEKTRPLSLQVSLKSVVPMVLEIDFASVKSKSIPHSRN